MKSSRRTFLTAAAGLAALNAVRPGRAQDGFETDIFLAVDTAKINPGEVRRSDEQRIEAALKRRLRLFSERGEGSVTFQGLSSIRLRVPAERVTPAQLQALVRPAQLQVYHLKDLRTGENADGRYEISFLNISGGRSQQSTTRFFDLKERKPVPPAEFFKRCPLVVTTADIYPNGAAVATGAMGLTVVRVQFADAATRKLEGFLRKRGEVLAIVLDGEIISMSATTGDGRERKRKKGEGEEEDVPQLDILGGFNTPEEAQHLATLFNAGALPIPLKVTSTRLVPEKD